MIKLLLVLLCTSAQARAQATPAPAFTTTGALDGIFKAGLIVEDLDRTLATLRARGVDIAMGPFPARAGQRANVIIRDNAGNLLQFFGR
jgi:hypothetical protein